MEVSFFYYSNVIFCLMLGHEVGPLKSLNLHPPWTRPRQLWFTTSAWHCYVETSCLLPNLMNLDCSNLQDLKNFFFFFKAVLYFLNFYLFIYLFMAVLGLRFCARAFSSCGERRHSSSRCAGLSPSRPLLLRSTGSRRAGSAIVAHGPSRSAACGIFPDQGLTPCALHWQADSQPLCHQGSPRTSYSWRSLNIFA